MNFLALLGKEYICLALDWFCWFVALKSCFENCRLVFTCSIHLLRVGLFSTAEYVLARSLEPAATICIFESRDMLTLDAR